MGMRSGSLSGHDRGENVGGIPAHGGLRADFDFQSHAVQTSVIDEAKATVFSHLQRSDCSIKKAAS